MEAKDQEEYWNWEKKILVTLRKRDIETNLSRKYRLQERGTMYVWAVVKQKIRADGIKIKRYDKRFQKFKQNQLFRTNHKLFYER